MAKRHRPSSGKRPFSPQVMVRLRQMPGTRVQFWAVEPCPYCAKAHYHPAGRLDDDPALRLGEVFAPCGGGTYVLLEPPKALRKKGKRERRRRWEEWEE